MSVSATPQNGLRSRADWRSVENLYKQFTSIVSTREQIPAEIVGALANSLGRVLAFYGEDEKLFVEDLLELWSRIDERQGAASDRFKQLYFDRRLDAYA